MIKPPLDHEIWRCSSGSLPSLAIFHFGLAPPENTTGSSLASNKSWPGSGLGSLYYLPTFPIGRAAPQTTIWGFKFHSEDNLVAFPLSVT